MSHTVLSILLGANVMSLIINLVIRRWGPALFNLLIVVALIALVVT